jgi:protein-arginine kinase activator protein McsA
MLCQKCQKNEAIKTTGSDGINKIEVFEDCNKCQIKEKIYFNTWFCLFIVALLAYLYGIFKGIIYLIKLIW